MKKPDTIANINKIGVQVPKKNITKFQSNSKGLEEAHPEILQYSRPHGLDTCDNQYSTAVQGKGGEWRNWQAKRSE